MVCLQEVKEALAVLVYAGLGIKLNVGVVLSNVWWLGCEDIFKACCRWYVSGVRRLYVWVMVANFPSQRAVIDVAWYSIGW